MLKYYIIRPDGSSVFIEPYPHDFCMHCLLNLLEVSDVKYMLMRFAEPSELAACLQADRGKGDESPLLALLELPEQYKYT